MVRSFGRPDHPGQATISRRYRCRRRLCPAHQQLLRFVRSCTMGAESQKQLLAHKAWTSLGSIYKARTVIPIPAILQLRRSSDKSVPQMVMPLCVRSFGRPDHPGQATISRRYRCRRRLCSAHQQLLRFVRSCTMGAESHKQLLVAHKAWTRLSSLADRSIRDKQRCRRYRCFRCRETHVISIGAPPINKPFNFCVGFG